MKKTQKQKQKKKVNILPLIAAAVVVIAGLCVLIPNLTGKKDTPAVDVQPAAVSTTAASATDISFEEAQVGTQATFYSYNAGGTTVEFFAVKASDGSVRLALNTCQVCNGSPYAYFVQSGDQFICQNCRNAFATQDIGIVHGGCNPIPITESDYTIADGVITVKASFLDGYASAFTNWKKF